MGSTVMRAVVSPVPRCPAGELTAEGEALGPVRCPPSPKPEQPASSTPHTAGTTYPRPVRVRVAAYVMKPPLTMRLCQCATGASVGDIGQLTSRGERLVQPCDGPQVRR
ncbi:hypothetical protein GCM10010300_72050 [Streptomyces olivaceoviridis]|nr:hypothetical protein GCM10010300_72050 [Streptomyces olivaceoviridis]